MWIYRYLYVYILCMHTYFYKYVYIGIHMWYVHVYVYMYMCLSSYCPVYHIHCPQASIWLKNLKENSLPLTTFVIPLFCILIYPTDMQHPNVYGSISFTVFFAWLWYLHALCLVTALICLGLINSKEEMISLPGSLSRLQEGANHTWGQRRHTN